MRFLRFSIAFVLLSCLAGATLAQSSPELETVSLQLKWFPQFQFAGFYAAKEKGFYAAEGLDVDIRPLDPQRDVIDQVIKGEADYAVADSSLVARYANGAPVRALAAIFQHDPLVFVSRVESGIVGPHEMRGKRLMFEAEDTHDASLRAMLLQAGLGDGDFVPVAHTFDNEALAQGQVDAMSAYITDQAYHFRSQGIAVNVVNPLSYGLDFYGDILFTAQRELAEHPGRAERFRRATLEGWRYALDHPEELVRLLKDRYASKLSLEHLAYEAGESARLIRVEGVPLGDIQAGKLKRVASLYRELGLAAEVSDAQIEAFIHRGEDALDLSPAEKNWLARHPVIRAGIDRDFAPFEWVDESGRYRGVIAEILGSIESMLGVRIEIEKERTWQETLDMARAGQLDMLTDVAATPEREAYLLFSDSFLESPIVIINDESQGFVGDIANLEGRRVAIEEGYFMQDHLRRDYPGIQLVPATNEIAAFDLLVAGHADAYIGDGISLNYIIEEQGYETLRYTGSTPYRSRHRMAVTHENPELLSILQKAIRRIPQAEKDRIVAKWMAARVTRGIDMETVVIYTIAVMLILSAFAAWNLQLRRSRRALQESESKLSSILEAVDACIYLKDTSGHYLFANRKVCELWNVTQQDIIGKGDESFFDAASAEQIKANDREVLAAGSAIRRTEMITVVATGRPAVYQSTKLPLYREDGQAYALCGISVDITERIRDEEELRRHRDHLRELVEEQVQDLTVARDEAQQANRAKGMFLANMSHEIRTPLAAILGLARIGARDARESGVHEHFAHIIESGVHLQGLVDDILDLSRLEAGMLHIDKQPLRLVETVESCLGMVAGKAQAKGLRLSMNMDANLPEWVSCDALRLRQMLVNLLSNAVKFTGRGSVSLDVARDGDITQFKVSDTGIGLSETQLQRLFEPFEQADASTTRKYGGSGLGLTISRQLARILGGDIEAHGRGDQGSTFVLTLPMPECEAGPGGEVARDELEPPALHGVRVLAAEDIEVNRLILEDLLLGYGARVDLVANGREAVAAIERTAPNHYDVVLMDIQMPLMDGYEATRNIVLRHPGLPVIGLTAHALAEERERCFACGMVDHVTKPIDPVRLVAAIRQQLEKNRPDPERRTAPAD